MKLLTKLKVLVTLTTVTVVAPAMVGHAETATPVTNNANALSIAAEGPLNNPTPDKSLNYYWNLNTNPDISDPTQTWGISQVAPPGSIYSAPSMARDTTANVIAAQGPNNRLNFYWNVIGDPTWHPSVAAGPGTTFSAPAVARGSGASVIAAQGPNNSLDFYWNFNGDPTWYRSVVAGPGSAFSAPAIVRTADSTLIAVQGPSNSLYFYYNHNGDPVWHPTMVGGVGTTFSAPSMADNGTATVIAAQGNRNSLDFYWATDGTSIWHPVVVAGANTTFSAPSIASTAATTKIAAEGLDSQGHLGGLSYYWATNGTPTWHTVQIPGGGTVSAPAIADNGRTTDIAVLWGYRNVVVYSEIDGQSTWNLDPVGRLYIP